MKQEIKKNICYLFVAVATYFGFVQDYMLGRFVFYSAMTILSLFNVLLVLGTSVVYFSNPAKLNARAPKEPMSVGDIVLEFVMWSSFMAYFNCILTATNHPTAGLWFVINLFVSTVCGLLIRYRAYRLLNGGK